MKYYFISNFGIFIVAVSCVLLAAGLIGVIKSVKSIINVEISIDYGKMVKNKLLIFAIVIVLILNCIFVPMRQTLKDTVQISLTYPGASDGLNPNGTRFDYTQILSDEVLDEVLESLESSDITIDELRSNLTVVQPNGNLIPNQYKITCKSTEKIAKIGVDNLTMLVCETYKTQFAGKYGSDNDILKIDFSDLDECDYLDMATKLDFKAKTLEKYMYDMAEIAGNFEFNDNGEAFYSIAEQITFLRESEIEEFENYITENGISKLPEKYRNILKIENFYVSMKKLKAEAELDNTKTAMEIYEDKLYNLLFTTAFGDDGEVYSYQVKTEVEKLAENAEQCIEKKNEYGNKIDRNEKIMEKLLTGGDNNTGNTVANNMAENIENELARLTGIAAELVNEYNERRYGNYMEVVPYRDVETIVYYVIAIEYTILFGAGAYICAVAIYVRKKEGGTE
jgi:hypothetical protein